MDYPQKVAAARKIQIAPGVQIVPQSGHSSALRSLAFHPQRAHLLAALDDSPCVHVWHVEFGQVIHIAPLPEGRYDTLRWVGDTSFAVRQLVDDPQQPFVWFVYTLDHIGRWRPSAEVPPIWPTPTPKPYATVHPEMGPCLLFPNGRWQRLYLTRRPLGLFADPLGRYVLDWLPNGVGVYGATDGRLIGRFEVSQGQQVTAAALEPQGGWGVQATDSGEVVYFDPMRPERLRKLAKLTQAATCVTISAVGLVAIGGKDSHIIVVDHNSAQRILRTGRAPVGFSQEVVLREHVGYAALRGETITAHLDEHAQLIPTMPMPARTSAIAPSNRSSAVIASLNNGLVVELDLRKREVTTRFDHGAQALLHLATASDGSILGVGQAELITFTNDKLTRHDLNGLDTTTILCAAVAPNAAYAALALHDGRVHVRRLGRAAAAATSNDAIEVPCHARAMTFVPYRNSIAVAIIDHNLVLWRLNPRKGDLRRIGLLDAPEGCLPLAQTLYATSDRDGSLRALMTTHNQHRVLLLVDAATGSTSLMGGWVVVGQQILCLYDDAGCWLRDTESSSLHMVHDFYPYSIEDWLRRPDLRGLDQEVPMRRRSRWIER